MGRFWPYRTGAMQDPVSELPRIPLMRLSEKPWRSLHRSTPGRLRGVFRPISPALHQPYSPPEYCLYPFSDSLSAGLWPLGCVAKRIGQPFHEDPWDFYHVGLCRRPVKSLDRKSTRLNSSHTVISYAV